MSAIAQVLFDYRKTFVAPALATSQENTADNTAIAAFIRNVSSLGFTFTPDAITRLKVSEREQFYSWAKSVTNIMKASKGGNFTYSPMYPNFPKQVMEAPAAELYLNAIIHYFGTVIGKRIVPEYDKVDRDALMEAVTATPVHIVEDEAEVAHDIFKNLASAKVSLSAADIDALKTISTAYQVTLPESIPNKENFATLAGLFLEDKVKFLNLITKASTPTDLLRLAAVLSGAHPSLADKFRFVNLPRPFRRAFLAQLNSFEDPAVDMYKYVGVWKRFGEKLHPAEHAGAYPNAAEAFRQVRSGNVIPRNSAVETLIRDPKSAKVAAESLAQRPGELARRLNELLSLTTSEDDRHAILSIYASVADQVSTPVLLQVLNYFTARKGKSDVRLFFPKSVTAVGHVIKDDRAALPAHMVDEVIRVTEEALVENYRTLEGLGKVYLALPEDDRTVHAVPFGLRSASKSFQNLGRGSRVPFNVEKTLRFFTYWKEDASTGRVDLDLSAVGLDKNFEIVNRLSYYDLRNDLGVHSGDLTSAPHGAAEYIDINVGNYAKVNSTVRYVAMSINSFTGQVFSGMDQVTAGFMERERVNDGEVFEAATVQNAFKVTANSVIAVPLVFDLEEGVAYWADLSVKNRHLYANNVDNNATSVGTLLKGVVQAPVASVEALFRLHAKARASEVVQTAEEADTVLGFVDGKMTVSMDELLSDWL